MATDGQAQEKTVKVLKGEIGVIVVAPHGHMENENEGDDDFTAIIAETIQKELNCYAVINEKYQRDDVNCNDFNSIEKSPEAKKEFLQPIIDFATILNNQRTPVTQVLIHGIEEENIQAVAGEGVDILLGRGQIDGSSTLIDRRETMSQRACDVLSNCLDEIGIKAIEAPVDSGYCGHDLTNVNQLFHKEKYSRTRYIDGISGDSIQFEIKKIGFRENPEQAKKAGVRIASALKVYLEKQWADRSFFNHGVKNKSFWSALSKNYVSHPVFIGDIDFEDRRFKSRLDTDSPESIKDLVKSIKDHGIINDVVLRKIGNREKLQVISGFRRLAAMREVFNKAGKTDEFQNTKLSVRVYFAITDDEAYEVSFTENLARKDLSLWEVARSCKRIADDLKPKGMSKEEIDDHLGKLVKKDPRTIRRYLKVGSIQNQDIVNAIHAGQLDITGAGLFARKEFSEEDRTALYAYYKRKPMPSRALEDLVSNLIALREWSGLSAAEILNHPNASEILKIDAKELESRVKEIQKGTDRTVIEILTNEIKALKKPKQPAEDKIKLDALPTMPKLLKLETALLQRSHKEASDRFQFHSKKRETYQTAQKKLANALEDKAKIEGAAPGEDGKVSGFYEWTKPGNIVNICFGCQNDCIYCFNKAPAYRRGWVEPGKWSDEKIRQHEIDANRGLFNGRVAFPTTHDITPNNLEGYITVLGKLLRAGNEILIVSKPRFDCIKRICDTSAFFKDEILFRFTIGAMDDKVLSYWEPNAPAFEERKRCLEYAHQQGFNTSVSVEPMLDSPNITPLIDELLPFVSDAIWIGKMNHINEIAKDADAEVKKALDGIEQNQTDEIILKIYAEHKDNPKIKWKDSIKKVVGIEKPLSQGMDV